MTAKAEQPTPPVAGESDVAVRVFRGHEALVYRVVLAMNGRFALTSSLDGTVRKWELGTTEEKSEIVCRAETLIGLAVTPDGQHAAAGDAHGFVRLFDTASGLEFRKWQGHKAGLGALAFLAEGRELVSAAADGFLRRWDTTTGQSIAQARLLIESNLYGVAVSGNGRQIVVAGMHKGLALWTGRDGAEPVLFDENVAPQSPVGLPADGRFTVTGTVDGKVALWDLTQRRRMAVFEGHSGSVCAVAVTPDGRFCVSSGFDRSVRLWAAESGQCLAILRGHTDWVAGVAITPDAGRIASVSADGTLRVWAIPETILARVATARKRGYVNAKVVLLGDSGVGKSGLALRLWHDRWEKTESSHGMEIQRLALPQGGGDADVVREVWLWDLAGQPDYRLTHQLFMEQTSLALLVFDPQDLNVFDTVAYWQSALRKVVPSGDVGGILVAARCDRPGLRLTMDEVRTWARARGLHGPILTAAKLKTHAGAKELRSLIAQLLPWELMEFRSTMENFPALKDAILAVRDAKGEGGVVVQPPELEARVRKAAPELTFTMEDLRAVTMLLAGEGVLHALPYGDLVVLQPSWVNSYASTLVKLAGEDEDHLGHVPLAIIQPGQLPEDGTPRLPLEDERQLVPVLVTLFLGRALAWKQDTDKGPMLVFPNYVRLPRPDPPPRPGLTVLYRFTGPLEEIYCTLVVRLHYSGLFAKTKLYRQAADFQTATGRLAGLTMKEEGERGSLEIYFGEKLDADVQASFQRFVHDHLKARAAGLERLRNFFCPKCGHEVTDRAAIENALTRHRPRILCVYCDPDDHPGMIDLHDVLEQQLFSGEGEAGANLARRKANDEISAASKEGVMVGEVQTIIFAADQIYRTVSEPDEGIDGEIEFRNARKRASGLTYRVQLKSGDSHLRKLSDGTEMFPMKQNYEELWAGKNTVPVLLIVRSSGGRLRYMNATDAIRVAQNANPGRRVKQIAFKGEEFTIEAVLRLRDARQRS